MSFEILQEKPSRNAKHCSSCHLLPVDAAWAEGLVGSSRASFCASPASLGSNTEWMIKYPSFSKAVAFSKGSWALEQHWQSAGEDAGRQCPQSTGGFGARLRCWGRWASSVRGSYRKRAAYKEKIYLLLNMIILLFTLLWCYRQITAFKGPKKSSGFSGPEQNPGLSSNRSLFSCHARHVCSGRPVCRPLLPFQRMKDVFLQEEIRVNNVLSVDQAHMLPSHLQKNKQ